jgi:hypothetical protein
VGTPFMALPLLPAPSESRNIRLVDKQTGELLRELTLDPTRDYQRQERQKPPNP